MVWSAFTCMCKCAYKSRHDKTCSAKAADGTFISFADPACTAIKKKKTLNKKRCAIQDWGCSIMTHVLCEHGPKRCTMPLTLAFQNVTIKYMRNEQ